MTGKELKAVREAAKLTQQRLGELIGMKHWRTISHLEGGHRNIGPGMEARVRLALAKAKEQQQ